MQDLGGCPVIINMNVSSINSIFRWCHEEITAFQSQCEFIQMKIPLEHRIHSHEIPYLTTLCCKELIHILTCIKLELVTENVRSISDYSPNIFV